MWQREWLIYLHELLILIIKRLSVFSVVKSGHTNYLFFFVDDWQRENVFYGPTTGVEWLSLQQQASNKNVFPTVLLSLMNSHLFSFQPSFAVLSLLPETGTSHQQLRSLCYKSEEQI